MPSFASFAFAAVVSVAAFAADAMAQQVLKKEPPAGSLRQGQVVRVDDGSCPRGPVRQVRGGDKARRCVAAPEAPGERRNDGTY